MEDNNQPGRLIQVDLLKEPTQREIELAKEAARAAGVQWRESLEQKALELLLYGSPKQ